MASPAATTWLRQKRSKTHYRDALTVTHMEHMTNVDCFDGASARKFDDSANPIPDEASLLKIHPVVDGRMKNVNYRS